MSFGSHGAGQYSTHDTSGGHMFMAPKHYRTDGSVRGVIFCHGVTLTEMQCYDHANNPNLFALVAGIANQYPVLSCLLNGDQWGNATAVTDMTDAYNYLTGTWGSKAGTVLLVGDSMGNLSAMNWARQNRLKVAAIVGLIPVSDLNDMVTNNRGGFAASINTAYATYNDATMGATSNPKDYAATDLTGVPTRLYYAADDTIVIPSTVTGLAASIGAAATALSLGSSGGHSDASIGAVSVSDVLTFLGAHA